ISRPGPPPLPATEQKEFEELVKNAQRPSATVKTTTSQPTTSSSNQTKELHPDARKKPQPEFEGEVNPVTGERGGPKREPVRPGSDWSFGGKVTDF
ncbi:hypothetical protein DL93DRAFT_2044500, partial [Clavulina sp. PMI_390]